MMTNAVTRGDEREPLTCRWQAGALFILLLGFSPIRRPPVQTNFPAVTPDMPVVFSTNYFGGYATGMMRTFPDGPDAPP